MCVCVCVGIPLEQTVSGWEELCRRQAKESEKEKKDFRTDQEVCCMGAHPLCGIDVINVFTFFIQVTFFTFLTFFFIF